jgi:hypothetical protein
MMAFLTYLFILSVIVLTIVIFLRLIDYAFRWPEPLPRPHQCTVCNRKYQNEAALNIHLKVHRQVCIRVPEHPGDCYYADQDDPFYIDGSEQCLKRRDKR